MSSAIIVIPCYNEAARPQVHTFQTFTCAQHALRFLFIDDGSTDDTWQVLEAIHLSNPRHCAIYQLPKNAGKAEAVRQGVLRAFAAGSDYVGYWDADLATPLEAIPAFCDARWLQARHRTPLRPLEEIVYELPLQEWRDVAGSKVRPSDFLKAFVGLALIYWTYLRSQANPGRDKEPCQGRPRGHDHRCGDAGP